MTEVRRTLSRYRTHITVVLASAAFAAAFVAVALSGFHQPSPHGLPLGVVAPAPVARHLEKGLESKLPGGFDVRVLSSEASARAQLSHRDIDGAVIATKGGFHLLTAEATGNTPTQLITTVFTDFATQSGEKLTVTDVVPPSSSDTEALSSFFLILCTLFPSLGIGIVAGYGLRPHPLASRLAVLVAFASITGLAAAGVGDAMSSLHHYWAVAGIIALFSLAISAPTAALGQVKPHLAGLCVLAFLVFGLAASGGPANLAAFGPGYTRSLTSALPLGVAVNAVRDTVYFHSAHTTGHLLVLTAYALGGVLLLIALFEATKRIQRRRTPIGGLGPADPPPAVAGGDLAA